MAKNTSFFISLLLLTHVRGSSLNVSLPGSTSGPLPLDPYLWIPTSGPLPLESHLWGPISGTYLWNPTSGTLPLEHYLWTPTEPPSHCPERENNVDFTALMFINIAADETG
ncbi:hypothetical protein N7530_007768 [Penicillium desertorum]|uniref:Uncharacterized protein n=1 Tax=Penicillium desertorum TaxID=1303715 RepID=A0A9W9WMZ5_9EURO|nr:hypothetical protein N7530_007768 [Penicillium desertorum]